MNVQLVQIRSRSLRLIAFCGHMFVVPSETLYLSVPQSLLELPAIKLTSHLVASFSDGNWN